MDSKQYGLASMACLGSLAAAQRHRSTSVRRQRSKPVRPTVSLSYLEGSTVEPPSKVQEVQQQEEFIPIQALACASSRVRGAVARCDSDVLRRQRPGSNQEPTLWAAAPRAPPSPSSPRIALSIDET